MLPACDAEAAVRVLVVEDELTLASLIRKGLREEGLLADVAVKGEDAIWMAAASPYDVIVLDVMLPGIDGFETCRRLRGGGVGTPRRSPRWRERPPARRVRRPRPVRLR
jgi:CheY-like chemotaxis protein